MAKKKSIARVMTSGSEISLSFLVKIMFVVKHKKPVRRKMPVNKFF
jgi:hypothetical protein